MTFPILAVLLVLTPGILAADKCTPGCVNCDAKNPSAGCTLCDVNYNLTPSKTCTPCPLTKKGCFYCDGPTKCKACNEGYLLSSKNKSCVKCSKLIPGCVQCAGTAENPFCNLCADGYAYNTDKDSCQRCPENCAFCEPTNGSVGGKCFQCKSGFAPTPDGKGCTKGCPANCEKCSALNTCQTCTNGEGFFLGPKNASCVACTKECMECKNSKQCASVSSALYFKLQSPSKHPCPLFYITTVHVLTFSSYFVYSAKVVLALPAPALAKSVLKTAPTAHKQANVIVAMLIMESTHKAPVLNAHQGAQTAKISL